MKTRPTARELNFAFSDMCNAHQHCCEECPLYIIEEGLLCEFVFAHDVLMGDRNLDGTLREKERRGESGDEPVKPALPKWCKVGQWIRYDADIEHRLGKILAIDDGNDPRVRVEAHSTLGFDTPEEESISIHSVFYPIRFRPYTDDEAEKLVGKVIKMKDWTFVLIGYVRGRKLPYEASEDNCAFCELQEGNATIDGVPVGVPEEDEDAMKEEL